MAVCSLDINENFDVVKNEKFIVNKLEPICISPSPNNPDLFTMIFAFGEDITEQTGYIGILFKTYNEAQRFYTTKNNLYFDNLPTMARIDLIDKLKNQDIIYIYNQSELFSLQYADYIIINGIIKIRDRKKLAISVKLLLTKNNYIKLFMISNLLDNPVSLIQLQEVLKNEFNKIIFYKAEHLEYLESALIDYKSYYSTQSLFNLNLGKKDKNLKVSFGYKLDSKSDCSKLNIVPINEYLIHISNSFYSPFCRFPIVNNGEYFLIIGARGDNEIGCILISKEMKQCIVDLIESPMNNIKI